MSDATYTPSAAEVKALRDTTQAGMMDCKRALAEAGGDMDAAVKLLREKGIASASKRSGRGTGEGLIETYVHAGGRIGSMVEIGCETDFVARTDDFRGFCRKVALQIAAARDLRFVRRATSPRTSRRQSSRSSRPRPPRRASPRRCWRRSPPACGRSR